MKKEYHLEGMYAISKLVWEFRKKHNPYWLTPTKREALMFAVTEVAEVIEAYLRVECADFARNNVRSVEMDEELADTAIMLVSAYPVTDHVTFIGTGVDVPLDALPYVVSLALRMCDAKDFDDYVTLAMAFVEVYAVQNKIDLVTIAQSRLERIYNKHVAPKIGKTTESPN